MSTPAQVRARAHAIRSVGAWMLVVGVFLALVAVIISIMDIQLMGLDQLWAACGSVLWPVQQVGPAIEQCALALGEQTAWAAGWGTIALALIITATIILVRTPRYRR